MPICNKFAMLFKNKTVNEFTPKFYIFTPTWLISQQAIHSFRRIVFNSTVFPGNRGDFFYALQRFVMAPTTVESHPESDLFKGPKKGCFVFSGVKRGVWMLAFSGLGPTDVPWLHTFKKVQKVLTLFLGVRG